MPLELDDREPPEDDPDAPDPAPTFSRACPVRGVGGNAKAVAAACAVNMGETIWVACPGSRPIAETSPVTVSELACLPIRAHRDLGSRAEDSGTNGR